MRRRKLILALIAIAVIALVVAVAYISCNAQNIAEKITPEINDVTLSWGNVTPSLSEIRGILTIFNPNSVSIPVTEISFELFIDGIKVGSGETEGLEIKENSEFPIHVFAVVENTKFDDVWTEHIRRNEKSDIEIILGVDVDLGMGTITIPVPIRQQFETDLLGQLRNVKPAIVEKKVNIPLLGEKTVFKVSLEALSGSWGRVTADTTQVDLSATIHNENPYPLLVPRLKCTIESNGLSVAYGETELLTTLGPGDIAEVALEVTLDPDIMGQWFAQHVRQDERSVFDIRVYMGFETDEGLLDFLGSDALTVTLWEGSQVVQTDILGQIYN